VSCSNGGWVPLQDAAEVHNVVKRDAEECCYGHRGKRDADADAHRLDFIKL